MADGSDSPVRTPRRRTFYILGALYVAAGALVLLWPSRVSTPFNGLLARLSAWIPRGDKIVEVAANAALFVPAGFLAAMLLPRGRRWIAIVGGVVISAMIELAQGLLLPNRVASLRDVLANSAGVVIGVVALQLFQRRRNTARPSHGGPPVE